MTNIGVCVWGDRCEQTVSQLTGSVLLETVTYSVINEPIKICAQTFLFLIGELKPSEHMTDLD